MPESTEFEYQDDIKAMQEMMKSIKQMNLVDDSITEQKIAEVAVVSV